MSNFKWVLLIVSLAVGSEITSTAAQQLSDREDGVYCDYICDYNYVRGYSALCFVVYKTRVNVMVARNPSYMQWKFYPLNTREYESLNKDPDSICGRIHQGDEYSGEEKCFPAEEKLQKLVKPTRYQNVYSNGYINANVEFRPQYTNQGKLWQSSGSCNDKQYARNLIAQVERTIERALQKYSSTIYRPSGAPTICRKTDVQKALRQMIEIKETVETAQDSPYGLYLNQTALPATVSYTSNGWADVIATLVEMRDEAEQNMEIDSQELVSAFNIVLPVLNAISVSSGKEQSNGNFRCLDYIINILSEFAPDDSGRHGNEGMRADGLQSRMEKVEGGATRRNAEAPKELTDDIGSSEKKRMESNRILNVIRDTLKAFSTDSPQNFLPENENYKRFENAGDFGNYEDYRKGEKRSFGENNNVKFGGSQNYEGFKDNEFHEDFENGGFPGTPNVADGSRPVPSTFPGRPSFLWNTRPIPSTFLGIHNLVAGARPVNEATKNQPKAQFGSAVPTDFNSQMKNIDIRSSLDTCQLAKKYLCENPNIMIYTSNDRFCLVNYANNFGCNYDSNNCFQEINYMLESVQWY